MSPWSHIDWFRCIAEEARSIGGNKRNDKEREGQIVPNVSTRRVEIDVVHKGWSCSYTLQRVRSTDQQSELESERS